MADIVSAAIRSRMMASIKAKDTQPELIIRRGLHARGFRYRLHDRKLPGCPDLVLSSRKAVIFVHGCFWHGHDCEMFRLPRTRREFWEAKIGANRQRDDSTGLALTKSGWRVMTVWECAIRGRGKHAVDETISRVADWLLSSSVTGTVRGV